MARKIQQILSLICPALFATVYKTPYALAAIGDYNVAAPDIKALGSHPPAIPKRSAAEVISTLKLTPNIEKGYFIETFRDPINVTDTTPPDCGAGEDASGVVGGRAASTAIYYLLEGAAGDSLWHRLDAAEVWHFYAGAPLELSLSEDDGRPINKVVLGPDVFANDGQRPQVVVRKGEWQRARSLGEWTLVGTTGELRFPFCMFCSSSAGPHEDF